jgi:hypothetical protein
MLGIGAFDHQAVRDSFGDGSVPPAARHHEQVSRVQGDRLASLNLDAKAAVPTEEQFVLFMGVPGEFAVEAGHAYNGVIGEHEVTWLPRPGEGGDGLVDRDGWFVHAFHPGTPTSPTGCGRLAPADQRLAESGLSRRSCSGVAE